MSETFDPTKHLRQLKGKGGTADYMEVKWRLVWLRTEHPNATTLVEHVEISPDIAIFKATVSVPDRGSATDYGSETPRDFGDYIEKAATKALGRALAQLGFGTQFVGFELDENTRIVDSPVERPDDRNRAAPRPAATPRAAQPGIVFTHNPPADSPLPHPLLATIRDASLPLPEREQALTDYYQGAHTIAELNKRQDAVKGSGLGSRVAVETYNRHAARIDRTPAGVAG